MGTPQQNGISEWTNRTLMEGIVALLQDVHLPASMWGNSLRLLLRIVNATPTAALPHTDMEHTYRHGRYIVDPKLTFKPVPGMGI
jgi:hypothetical protein